MEKPLDLFSLQSQVRSCPGIFLQFCDIEKLANFFPNFSQIYNEKKNPKKLQNVSLQNSNDLMCVMKVALQRFAYIDALY